MTPKIQVTNIQPITPHNEALLEAGKEMLVSSIKVSRDLCYNMILICTSAIPVYIALLKFFLPEKYVLTFNQSIFVIITSSFYLASFVIFTYGYLPQIENLSLDIIESIDETRNKILKHRYRAIIVGYSLFIVAVILSICSLTIIY